MCGYTLPAWQFEKQHDAYCIDAIILLDRGWTPSQVTEVLLIAEGSIRTYFKDFLQYGKEGLIERDYTGRESFDSSPESVGVFRQGQIT